MAKDKLPTLKRLARDAEHARGRELAQMREERLGQEAQAQSLQDMLDQYRDGQVENGPSGSAQLAIFQRFYTRVRETLVSHGDHVETLKVREEAGERAWLDAYQAHQAITKLHAKRIAQQRRESTRKERRAGVIRRWTMLNTHDEQRGD